MGYDRSYISKIENGTDWPAVDFARRADEVLAAGGALRRAYTTQSAATRVESAGGVSPEPDPTGLVVDHDEATLYHVDGAYRATQHRRIINRGDAPVSRYLIRISVDRYPGSPERSNELYRANPLTWKELELEAFGGDEPMRWRVQHDRDAFKELWLQFENDDVPFPLYPGQSADLHYSYTVGEDKWGQWFQRAVRLPTRHLAVGLDFPSDFQPSVWGVETSMTAEAVPFRTPIQSDLTDGRTRFTWSTEEPPLHARYRLEWRLGGRDTSPVSEQRQKPSEQMAAIGIVQDGDRLLREPARSFDLPAEAEDARRVVTELHSAMERAAAVHTFSKGMGVAAPQIGIPRSAAVVRTPDGELITLLNPTVVEHATDTDEQYEGCLSFFDVRGKVARPLSITVEHTDIDGRPRLTTFERGIGRLVSHEIDHLDGKLYTDRMPDPAAIIPVGQYRGTGQTWNYK
jgi:peptide deformylase